MRFLIPLFAALLAAVSAPASAQVNVPLAGCDGFQGFPLNLRLGTQLGNTDNVIGSESPRCSNQKIMAATNALNAKSLNALPSGRKAVEQGDASDLTNIIAAPGAVSRNLQNKFLEFMVSVLEFGAKCDNVTDDTSSIQAAANYAATLNRVARVYLPAMCRITDEINKPNNSAVIFESNGPAGGLRQTTPNKNGINFVNTGYSAHTTGVRNMTIEAGAGYQSANSFAPGSSGTGINVVKETLGFTLQNVWVTGYANGITFYSVHNTENYNVKVNYFSGDGIRIDSDPGDGSAGNSFIGGIIGNANYTGDASNSVGIRIRSSGGEWFKSFDIVAAGNAWKIDPPAGKQVAYVWFHQVLADTSINDGCVLDGSAGSIIRIDSSSSWCSFSGGAGLRTAGGNLHGFRASNLGLRENAKQGWLNTAPYAAGIDLTNPDIHSNSRINPGVYSGVEIGDGVGGPKAFSIIGGSIGNTESAANNQANGVLFAGAASGFRIEGVDLSFWGSGKVPLAYDETKLSNFRMMGNLPASTGVNISERETRDFFGTISSTGGVTAYFGPSGIQGTANLAPFSTGRPQAVSQVTVNLQNAPGAGITNAYRLTVNGTPVGATGTISGASSYTVSFSPGVSLNTGDTYGLQAVIPSGAAAGLHYGSIRVEP